MIGRPLMIGFALGLLVGVSLAWLLWDPLQPMASPFKPVTPTPYLPAGMTVYPAPPASVASPTVPPDWQPRIFNGHTYYIVPLAMRGAVTAP
jgi:hypothetical protein